MYPYTCRCVCMLSNDPVDLSTVGRLRETQRVKVCPLDRSWRCPCLNTSCAQLWNITSLRVLSLLRHFSHHPPPPPPPPHPQASSADNEG